MSKYRDRRTMQEMMIVSAILAVIIVTTMIIGA